jgi:carbonic anhydrase/acetyltransferase-like protein (isoleucine patch superfamily)
MVGRLAEAMGTTETADRIVKLTLENALALTKFMAHTRGYDLDSPELKKRGWMGYLGRAKRDLEAHLGSGFWEFKDAEPANWHKEGDAWMPNESGLLLAIAPDAFEQRKTEEELLACEQKPLDHTLGVTAAELERLGDGGSISDEADVHPDAMIGPGVIVAGASKVEAGAALFGTIVDNSTVGSGTRIARSSLNNSTVGSDCTIAFTLMDEAEVGAGTEASCARIKRSSVAANSTISPCADLMNVTAAYPTILGGRVHDASINTVLMSMHMAGVATGMDAFPSTVTVAGEDHEICPVPMLGGGSRLLGTAHTPVGVEASFVGSNATVEAGAFVGFGSFVLGRLTGDEGLPPFTVSFAPGPDKDQIGAVLAQFANMLLTHVVGWTFQANGPEKAHVSANMMVSIIAQARDAVQAELDRRTQGAAPAPEHPSARYKSLPLYSEAQLKSGLDTYEENLADGRWEMGFIDSELRFTGHGKWEISGGAARWVKKEN